MSLISDELGAGNTVFDGESKVKDVFADVIIQKFLRDREKKHLHKREAILYNEHSVPQNQVCLDCAVKHTEAPESSAGDEC